MRSTGARRAFGPRTRLLEWLGHLTAVEYVSAAGLLWLLAYVFSGPIRDWTLGVLWRLETLIADALGLTLRQVSPSTAEPDRMAAAAVIVLYCLISLALSGQRARGLPSADELVGGNEPGRSPARSGALDR